MTGAASRGQCINCTRSLEMIPRDLNDLSVEFFSSILACPVASFTPDDSSTIFQGNTSVLYSVLINFAAPLTFPPRRLFLKFALPAEEGVRNVSFSRKTFIDADVYRKEVEFYKYIKASNEIPDLVPQVFYAEIEPAGSVDHFLLVLGEAGQPLNQLTGCSLDTSRSVMSQAARLHAHFLLNPPQDCLPSECVSPAHQIICQIVYGPGKHPEKTPTDLLEYCSGLFEAEFEDFSHVALALGKKADFNAAESIEIIRSRFADKSIFSQLRLAFHNSFLSPSFRTLIHGDFRLDNMLLCDSLHVKFIDFQAIHYGHPSYDLAQFIIQCHNDSHVIFNDLLTIYFNTLCEQAPKLAAAGQLGTLQDLIVSVKAASIFQILLLSFHLAPLKSSIDPETGLLPPSMDRFMDLLALITKRALTSFLLL